MKARLVKFGEIEVEGKRYTHDVVIDGGKVRKRKKGPSKQFREKFGHTPLSAGEEIPWGGKRLMGRDRRPWRASRNGRSLSRCETTRYRGHCGADTGSLSDAGGSEEGPGLRHPALHVLTGDLCSVREGGLTAWLRTLFPASSNQNSRKLPACSCVNRRRIPQ